MAVIILFLIYVALMLPFTESAFWVSLFIVSYTYAGYPLLLMFLLLIKSLTRKPQLFQAAENVAVTMIVAAYNEQEVIEEKINNCLSVNYPKNLIRFIFITDGSDDDTASIVEAHPFILHLHQHERKGKLAAMNRAMKHVETEIVIFSDANTFLNADSIRFMVAHFADDKVGGVSGEKKIFGKDGVARGEGLYWRYESFLKNLDSRLNTVVGAAGELLALRTSLYTELPEHIIIEDFVQSLLLCRKGYVVRYEPRAFCVETASLSEKEEMERKMRIAAGGFQAMGYLKSILHIFRHPLLSFQYISHRVLRWTLCPLALIVLFITSMALWSGTGNWFYAAFAALQAVGYISALAGWILVRNNKNADIFYIPFYFAFMNMSVIAGFYRYITGGQRAMWQKASRKQKNNV